MNGDKDEAEFRTTAPLTESKSQLGRRASPKQEISDDDRSWKERLDAVSKLISHVAAELKCSTNDAVA